MKINKRNLGWRILTLPIFTLIIAVSAFKGFLLMLRDWTMFGGEVVAYKSANERQMIATLYEEMVRQYKDKYCKCTLPSTDFDRTFCFKCHKQLKDN